MPITLRARPTCHYCGKRNSPSSGQRKFTCQYCQADNYLDESGQITDVPTSAVVTSQRYAVPRTPAFEVPEGSLFCSTCLKNQYMYNAALAEYLPDPDHPEYDKFEAAIPAFKEDLERRFPTCCANCEPKIKAQLQQATYNARSDHLRRVLDRSRQRRIANRLGWRSLLVNAAGLGWSVSLTVQLAWHALGSQTHGQRATPDLRLAQCLATWPVPVECSLIAERSVGPSLLLGVICVWWNPKWQHKLEGREGRLIGLDKFYKVQCMLLALRFVSWTVVKDIPGLTRFQPAMHAVSLVLIIMVAGWSYFGIIGIYMPRIVDWSQNPAPLLDKRQYVPPAPARDASLPSTQPIIPVGIFNTAAAPTLQSWRPPSPPVDEDAMEWDPTPATFSPVPKNVKYKSSEPSPFQGTLPAFSRGSIYNAKRETADEQPKAIGLPPGFFDKSADLGLDRKSSTSAQGMGLAQPKFFPDIARVDTGLENIFEKVFSLQDGAGTIARRASDATQSVPHIATSSSNLSLPARYSETLNLVIKVCKSFAAAALATSITYFSAQQYFQQVTPWIDLDDTICLIFWSVPWIDLVIGLFFSEAYTIERLNSSRTMVLALENLGLLALYNTKPGVQSLLLPLWNKLVIAMLALVFVQQIYDVCVGGGLSSGTTGQVSLEADDPIPPPMLHPILPPQPIGTPSQSLRRSASDESLASATSATTTTSTASGWKTPIKSHREELASTSSSTSYKFGGLSLKNDHGFGVGNNIAGPRTKQTPARGAQRGW